MITDNSLMANFSAQYQSKFSSPISMNPTQSQSFWLNLLLDDISTRLGPHSSLPFPYPSLSIRRCRTVLSNACRAVDGLLQQRMKAPEWSADLEKQLFELQRIQGNKWSAIATLLGVDDNAVKNKFYSTLRRGLRKLNRYISQVRRKKSATHLAANKFLKDQMLVKVNAVADKTHEDKYEVKAPAIAVSQAIQQGLIQLAGKESLYEDNPQGEYPFEEELLGKIQQFNRNCKRRKGKRKIRQQDGSSEEVDEGRRESQEQIGLKVEKSDATLHTTASIIIQTSLDLTQKSEQKSQKLQIPLVHREADHPPHNAAQQMHEESQRELRESGSLFSQGSIDFQKFFLSLSQSYEQFSKKEGMANFSRFFESTPTASPVRTFAEELRRFQEGNNLHSSVSSFNSRFFNQQQSEPGSSFLDKIPNLISDHRLIESGSIRKELMEELLTKYSKIQRTKSESRQKGELNEGNYILSKGSLPNLQTLMEKEKEKRSIKQV